MNKPITVGYIRTVLADLEDDAIVLVKDERDIFWELGAATGAHDGRYGNILSLTFGSVADPWNNQEPSDDYETETKPTNVAGKLEKLKRFTG